MLKEKSFLQLTKLTFKKTPFGMEFKVVLNDNS